MSLHTEGILKYSAGYVGIPVIRRLVFGSSDKYTNYSLNFFFFFMGRPKERVVAMPTPYTAGNQASTIAQHIIIPIQEGAVSLSASENHIIIPTIQEGEP